MEKGYLQVEEPELVEGQNVGMGDAGTLGIGVTGCVGEGGQNAAGTESLHGVVTAIIYTPALRGQSYSENVSYQSIR